MVTSVYSHYKTEVKLMNLFPSFSSNSKLDVNIALHINVRFDVLGLVEVIDI